jgi:hypothetical protein
MKKLALSGSALASATLAFVLLSVSPPGCGCETPIMAFGWEFEMFTPPDYALPDDLVPSRVLAAANRLYLGKPVTSITPPKALRDEPCIKSPSALQCTYWFASGPLRATGLKVEFISNSVGIVSKIEVKEVTRWN